MDDKSFTIRVPKRWVRISMIVGITALIVAPLTAVATHTFNDVPNTHTFHADIEWLEASGVTKGCNPPTNTLYCPDDFVTRGQMAAFMERFAGYLGAKDGTPAQADNADTVDGKHANQLVRIARSSTLLAGTVNSGDGWVTVASVDIVVPPDALTAVSGLVTLFGTDNDCPCLMTTRLRHVASGALSNQTYEQHDVSGYDQTTMSGAWVFDTGSGTQSFQIQVLVGTGANLSVAEPVITAQTVAFGSSGGSTLDAASGSNPSGEATP